jgi:hypothetical protein
MASREAAFKSAPISLGCKILNATAEIGLKKAHLLNYARALFLALFVVAEILMPRREEKTWNSPTVK